MPQILTKIEDILKANYLPALKNQLNTDPSPFYEKVTKRPLTNNEIIGGAPIGLNGGFGFGEEGSSTPSSGEQKYAKYKINPVDMYVNIEISNKTIQLANNNKAAMLNALDMEIKGSYAAAKWNIARSLFGDGTGKLATVTALEAAGTEVTVSDTSKLIEGLKVDFYAAGAATGSTPSKAGVRILSINRKDKKITVDTSFKYVAGFITVQNSYGRELTGLGAIMDTSVTSLYGLTKSTNAWINPTIIDASNDISDLVLYEGVSAAKTYKNSVIDMILMGDAAFKAYQSFMQESTTQIVEKLRFEGGAVGYKVITGDRESIIVNEHNVPTNEAWGVDTTSFHMDITDWNFADYNGSAFVLKADSSIYRALLAAYGNLMCDNPGGCVKWTNCNASA